MSRIDESSVLYTTKMTRWSTHKELTVGIRNKSDTRRMNPMSRSPLPFWWRPHSYFLWELVRMQIPLSLLMDKWRCHFTYLSMVKWTEAGKKPVQERQPDLGNILLNVMPHSFISPSSTSCCFHFCYKICDVKTWSFLFWYIVSAVLVSEVPRHNLPSLRARRSLGLPFL